jgi:hypothetical protein
MICVIPITAFPAWGGSESSKNGCAYTDGTPIIKIKNAKRRNLFILHKTN